MKKVILGHKVILELRVQKVILGHKVILELKVQRDKKVHSLKQ